MLKVKYYDWEQLDILENVREVRSNLQILRGEENCCYLLTSPSPAQGTTTIAAHLALSFARHGEKTLLIDGNYKHPTLHELFQINNENGFISAITEIRKDTYKEVGTNLYILPLEVANEIDVMESNKAKELITSLKSEFKNIIIDGPSYLNQSSAKMLATFADYTIFIIEDRKTPIEVVQRMKDEFEKSKCRIAGVVVNNIKKKNISNYSI